MLRIKENIRFTGENMNIKFILNSHENFYGFQQEIDNLTQIVSNDLINPINDIEIRKFKYTPNIVPTNIVFYFNNGGYLNTFLNAGFTSNEITYNDDKLLKSFFILEFYDSFDINNQNKIFTTYLTKILNGNNKLPFYRIHEDTINQFYFWYVPISYIESESGSTTTGYTKLSFFNAKSGEIVLFYNNDNINLSTSEKMFFKTELNLNNKTWKFITNSFPTINAYQSTTNYQYINKTTNSFDKIDNKKQQYPKGNTFNSIGVYLTT